MPLLPHFLLNLDLFYPSYLLFLLLTLVKMLELSISLLIIVLLENTFLTIYL